MALARIGCWQEERRKRSWNRGRTSLELRLTLLPAPVTDTCEAQGRGAVDSRRPQGQEETQQGQQTPPLLSVLVSRLYLSFSSAAAAFVPLAALQSSEPRCSPLAPPSVPSSS